MGMGSAYAAGGGLVKEQDSYVPLIQSSIARSRLASESGIADRKMTLEELKYAERDQTGLAGRSSTRRGSSSADTENARRATRLAERRQEQEEQEARARKNQYMAQHHGREPTPEELADTQYERDREEKGLDRDERARQFDEMRAFKKEDIGRRKREFDAMRASENESTGLAERKNLREQQKHEQEMKAGGMTLSQEEQTLDFDNMMKAYATGDLAEVTAWFIRNGTPGDDKSLHYPIFKESKNPKTILVAFPGKEQQEMSKDAFGVMLTKMNPKYERRPKDKKEKPMSRKGAAKAAADYAKGASVDDPDRYQELYDEKFKELTGEGGQQGGKTVVRRQQNSAEQIRETFNDGSWIIKDKTGTVIKTSEQE